MSIDETLPEISLLSQAILDLVKASQEFSGKPWPGDELKRDLAEEKIQLALQTYFDRRIEIVLNQRLEQYAQRINQINGGGKGY